MQIRTPWSAVSDDVRAHALSLTIGRYFSTPCLLSRWRLEDYLCFLAVMIEVETGKLVKSYGEDWPELPPMQEPPVFAQTLIAQWKENPALRERYHLFVDYLEAAERAIEQGIPIESVYP